MEIPSRCCRLAAYIKGRLDQGLLVGKDIFEFSESALGITSLKEMAVLLETAGEEAEADLLCELIFFPDAPVFLEAEPLLQRSTYCAEDEAWVVAHLQQAIAKVRLYTDSNHESAWIPLPRRGVGQFVTKMRITRKIEPELNQMLDLPEHAEYADAVRVRLRQSQIAYTPLKVDFLSRCVAGLALQRPFRLDLLDFAVRFLEETANPDDLYAALMKKKRLCFLSLYKASQFSEKLRQSNMETIMLSGLREPCVDQAEMHATIQAIDTLCWLVFGKSDPLPLDQLVVSVHIQADDRDFNQMMHWW